MGLGFAVFVAVLFSGLSSAQAGFRLAYEAVSYSSEEEDTPQVVSRQKNVMLIDDGKLRTVGQDASGFDLIANLKTGVIHVLDAVHQAYSEIPFVSDSDLPPTDTGSEETSEMLQILVEDTGPETLGYRTHKYRIYEDSILIREITTTEQLNMGFDFMQAMEGLEHAFQEFSPAENFGALSLLYRQVRGVPLIDIQYYPQGLDVLQATKVERIKFKPEQFLPPKNYAKKPLQSLSEDSPESSEKK